MISSLDYASSSSSSSSQEDSEDDYRETDQEEEKDQEEIINNEKYDKIKKKNSSEAESGSSSRKRSRGKTKGKNHQCPFCEKTFTFPNKLREHVKTHKADRYCCLECDSDNKFDTINQLRAHQKKHHSQASHNCPQCSYTNEKRAFIRRHFQTNHIDGIPCTVSGCSIKVAKNRLKYHIKEMHTATDSSMKPLRAKLSFHKCPRCNYLPDESIIDSEEQHKDLMIHIKTAHEKKGQAVYSFGCGPTLNVDDVNKACSTATLNEPSTSTSIPELHDDGCRDTNTVTSQSTTSEPSTRYPNDYDSEGEPAPSEELSNNMNDISIEEENNSNEPPFKMKKSKSGSRVRGDFSCEICSKTFTMRDNLRKHIRVYHSGNPQKKARTTREHKEFKCERASKATGEELCGKTFRTEQALHDHHNVHDDIKPYACLTCNQRFYGRDRFAVHLSKYHLTSIKDLNANEAQFGTRKLSNVPADVAEATTSDGPMTS